MNDTEPKSNPTDRRFDQLEATIQAIAERNERVEADKAWETSLCRRLSILFVTYCITAVVFWQLGVSNPLANALVPTTGYWLSTLTLPVIKRWWIGKNS